MIDSDFCARTQPVLIQSVNSVLHDFPQFAILTGRFSLLLFPRHTSSLKFAFFLGAILYAVLSNSGG